MLEKIEIVLRDAKDVTSALHSSYVQAVDTSGIAVVNARYDFESYSYSTHYIYYHM